MTKVAFHTLGCKVNHYESEAMMDIFKEKDYDIVDFKEGADIYIINTCTVTNEAARKSRQIARRAKRNNPEALVAMVGCYTQVSPEEVKNIEGIDLIIGTANRRKIVDMVEKIKENNGLKIDVLKRNELIDFEELRVNTLRETTRAFVKIQEGCNQFCSYCIIPYARGPIRSRKISSIINEVQELVARGVKEIVLTGTHLGVYGYDWGKEDSLTELICQLNQINGLAHIRLSSIEATEISNSLLTIMAGNNKMCPHLHLPLQSGSEKILSKMRRPYTKREFKITVEKLRKLIPDIAITTDIIVGFPGEDEELFQESYNFTREIEFSRLHVFPYSPREGTPAARMKGQINSAKKKEYSQKIRDLNQNLMKKYQKKFIGKIREAIIEERRDPETGMLVGVTDNYLRVLVDSVNDEYQGKLVRVKITGSRDFENVCGKIIQQEKDFCF